MIFLVDVTDEPLHEAALDAIKTLGASAASKLEHGLKLGLCSLVRAPNTGKIQLQVGEVKAALAQCHAAMK